MKIVINGRFLSQSTTGIQRVGRELVRALDALIDDGTLGHVSARIVAPRNARIDDFPLRRIPIERVGWLSGHAWEQLVLPRHLDGARLVCLGNVAPIETLLRHSGGKVALFMHDMSYRLYPRAYRAIYRYGHTLISPALLHFADPVVTVSESEYAQIIEYAPYTAGRLVVARNGSWHNDLQPTGLKPWAERRNSYGLYVGAFSSRKNIESVLDLAIALARDRGIRFVFVGSGAGTFSATHLDCPADIRHLIEFRGQIESKDVLEQIYREAAFLVFPSFYEASPLPPVEAMTFGCPVVGSDIPSMRERCGDAAAYCDPANRASIRAAVDRLLDEDGLADALITAGFRQSAKQTWRAQAFTLIEAMQRR